MKILYEATLLLCCAIVIFLSTVSGVLILLLWRHELFFGVNTRLVVFLCAMIVVVFSVGFVGTIAESSRALVLYAALLALFPLSIILVEIILRLWASPGPTVALKTVPPMVGLNDNQSAVTTTTTTTPTTKQSAFTPTHSYPSFASNPSPPTTHSTSSWNDSWIALPGSPFTTELPLSTQFYQLFREYKAPSPTSGPRTTHLKASEAARNLWRELFSTDAGDNGSDGPGTIVKEPGTSSIVPGSSIEAVLLVALAFVLVQIAIAHLLAAEIRRLQALENQSNISEEEEEEEEAMGDDCAYNEANELFQLEHDSIMMKQFHPSATEIVELVDPSASSATTASLKGTTTMECCLVTFQPEVHYVSTAEAEAASSAIDSETALLSSLQHHHHRQHEHHHHLHHHHRPPPSPPPPPPATTDIKQPRVHFHSSPQYFGDTTADRLNATAATASTATPKTTTTTTTTSTSTTSTVTPTSCYSGTAQIIIPAMNATPALCMGPIAITTTGSENNNFSETEMILTPRRGCT